jgi:hypothetical protein
MIYSIAILVEGLYTVSYILCLSLLSGEELVTICSAFIPAAISAFAHQIT